MKHWEAHVWKTTHKGRVVPNYYEGKFKYLWIAYLVVRFEAWLCDLKTPDNGCCYGIYWGIKPIDNSNTQ